MDAEQVQSEPQPAEQQQEAPKEFDGYIDFDKWDDVKPEQVRERLDRETRIKREQDRKLQQAEAERKKLEKELLELRKPVKVERPSSDLSISDPDEFERQLNAYEQSILSTKDYEFEQRKLEERDKQEAQRQQQERIGKFNERAQSAKLDMQKVSMAAGIAMQQLPENMHGYLADHQYGPQLLVRLAENPMEMQELASLGQINPYEAGVKLNQIAETFKRSTTSNAPPPDDPVKGSGVQPTDESSRLGITYS